MKNILNQVSNKLTIPYFIYSTFYFIFSDEMNQLPFILLNLIRFILIASAIILVVDGCISMKSPKKQTERYISNSFLDYFYYYSEYITNYIFYGYYFVYIIFGLYKKAIYFDYIMVCTLSLYLGYGFARYSFNYLRKSKP